MDRKSKKYSAHFMMWLNSYEKLVNPLGPVVELEEYGFDDKLNVTIHSDSSM
ncbi:hypothetical protein HPK13_14800 [Anoxybacillus flavithermus]|uniref:hypothetical protein n=1 Tax=Anoxybacillus flavithermus TaxID=33934 RepID=UPI00186938B7|nr:hypothetical protein [Anoxybacillus flavithermus]MBE2944397.1 hypothetical protein [Anoxybacillus flavithermus]MBE2955293.1 hypothetical protein [Anoxybacillus flavithermus]